LIAHEGTEGGGINGRMVAYVVSEFSGGEVVSPVIFDKQSSKHEDIVQVLG